MEGAIKKNNKIYIAYKLTTGTKLEDLRKRAIENKDFKVLQELNNPLLIKIA